MQTSLTIKTTDGVNFELTLPKTKNNILLTDGFVDFDTVTKKGLDLNELQVMLAKVCKNMQKHPKD